jgi:photolyase PhrII
MSAMTSSALREAARALDARVRVVRAAPARSSGRYVLYWCTTALRAEENPAFERAVLAAHKLDQPLLVYHGLSARYAHANDRMTGFVLEGEPSLREAFCRRGARYVFALDRGAREARWLDRVASEASVVITDEFPVYDVRAWVERFAARYDGPVLAVDAACVVPMRSLGRSYERAFAFRERVTPLWKSAVEPIVALAAPRGWEAADVPLDPAVDTVIDPDAIADVLASLPIDHSVPRSAVLRGGCERAHERWSEYLQRSIDRYALGRNDALDDEGVSRMSAWLHWGMIWAGRLARDAMQRRTEGADKWLDELLVWRELAWHYCAHNGGYDRVETALPAWALKTLTDRARPMFSPSELSMELGETGDALWDAAQQRLRRDGWLHNNLRMTWGKQIVAWTHDPARALRILESLNHRYAIDGRDPASYGGLLWCMGQFDRPHPRSDEWGTVRPRETRVHARRLDVDAYRAKGARPGAALGRVLVIGAGIAGAFCARSLIDGGADARVLEKSAGAGGRIASRRAGEHRFSHGAPLVHSARPWFARWLEMLSEQGALVSLDRARWAARGPMTAVVRSVLARCADRVSYGVRATAIERTAEGWRVRDDKGAVHECERLVLALPAPQAAQLAATAEGAVNAAALEALSSVAYDRCLVAMALCEPGDRALEGDPERRFDDAVVERVFCEPVTVDGAPRVAVTAYATAAFSEAHDVGEGEAPWRDALLDRARSLLELGAAVSADHKRWRYARVRGERRACVDGASFLVMDERRTLFAVGDGVASLAHGRDAEAAWASATALASWLLSEEGAR